ncbi:UNVERIFIED_CONTAM: hypothetical protein RMT77_011417 [Armadillidium vulgare]
MQRSLTFPFLTENHALYLPDNLNFWTLATVALGSAFLFLVIITIVVIYRTEPETILPVRASPTVNHINTPEPTTNEVHLVVGPPTSPNHFQGMRGSKPPSEMLVSPEYLMDQKRLLLSSNFIEK